MQCVQKEMRYDTGYALHNRVLVLARSGTEKLFKVAITNYWTPHSGRCFLPSSTAALKYEKSQLYFLGGWSARRSDVYARIARVRIGNLQNAVISALQSTTLHDPIAESEISDDLMAHLDKQKIEKSQQKEISSSLEIIAPIPARDQSSVFTLPEVVPDEEKPLEDPFDVPQEDSLETEKRRTKFDLRTEQLGSNPRETRRVLREQLEQGFYISYTRKKHIRILHRLGSCYNLPGLDYQSYRIMGTEMPASLEYDNICHLCARKDVKADPEDSSGTCTSSSTDAEDTDETAV